MTGVEEEEGFEPSAEGFAGLWQVGEDRDTGVDRMVGGSGRGGGPRCGDNASLAGLARMVLEGTVEWGKSRGDGSQRVLGASSLGDLAQQPDKRW